MTPPPGLPQFLTHVEWAVLNQSLEVDLYYHVRRDGQWKKRHLTLQVDARALGALAESAARGHRLYEFMRLERLGDILRYWWVEASDVGVEFIERVNARMSVAERIRFRQGESSLALPFIVLDACFWRQELRWTDPDADELDRVWVDYRQRNPEQAILEVMLSIVQAAQVRLRASAKALQAHELALIDARRHSRDRWPKLAPVAFGCSVPAACTHLNAGLFEAIVSLARRDEVRSLSCSFDDPILWQELVWVQVQRAQRENCASSEALLLAGPDGGLSHFEADDRGGDIHIPYEGARDADVFVKPQWYAFDERLARSSGSVYAGLHEKAHRYALMEGYFGEFRDDECVRIGDWSLYRLGVRRARNS